MGTARQHFFTKEQVHDYKKERLCRAKQRGKGLLRLRADWVYRFFCQPNKDLRLADYFPPELEIRGKRQGIDERWQGSILPADLGADCAPGHWHPGLSMFEDPDGGLVVLREAMKTDGAEIVGQEAWDKFGGLGAYTKFFNNLLRLGHHMHDLLAEAIAAGKIPKPEGYYISREYNKPGYVPRDTLYGLRPEVTMENLRTLIAQWIDGRASNAIEFLANTFRMFPEMGFLMPACMLHGPAGQTNVYEPQRDSDVYAFFQSLVADGPMGLGALLKDIPEEFHKDVDAIMRLMKLEQQKDSRFVERHSMLPLFDPNTSQDGVKRNWVVYGHIEGKEEFSVVETTVEPGASGTITDYAASIALITTGDDCMMGGYEDARTLPEGHDVHMPNYDEYYITREAAQGGWFIENRDRDKPMKVLQTYGPEAHGVRLPHQEQSPCMQEFLERYAYERAHEFEAQFAA